MCDRDDFQNRIVRLLADKMEIPVCSVDADLFDEGLLDSLSYVRLVVEMQQEFDTPLSLSQIDIDHFRTVNQMADFLMQHQGVLATV